MKGLPTGYNKDLQEDKEPVFDCEDTLQVSLVAARAVLAHLTLRPDRTRAGGVGFAAGHRRRRLPGARGVPFRQAHEIVGGIVRHLLEKQRDFSQPDLDEWRALQPAFRGGRARRSPRRRRCGRARRRNRPPGGGASGARGDAPWLGLHTKS